MKRLIVCEKAPSSAGLSSSSSACCREAHQALGAPATPHTECWPRPGRFAFAKVHGLLIRRSSLRCAVAAHHVDHFEVRVNARAQGAGRI